MESETDIEAKRTHCIRCGECCLATGPSLQKADLPLFYNHVIDGTHLYTIRKGELVRDNIHDELKLTDQELLKFRDREEGKGCIFYDGNEKTCTIYGDRPSQCRAFGCWDDTEFEKVFSGPKARRKDIVKDSGLLRLIFAHETKCNYETISSHVEQIPDQGEKSVQEIL
ncbi:MAG TPA: YkgJ family cysteine cluster protein, partial [Desulfobacteria bacterium]|nr:YkgJ family cysteine cluster protein [Desulfobacteria bacterium]